MKHIRFITGICLFFAPFAFGEKPCEDLTAAECAHTARCIIDCDSDYKGSFAKCKRKYYCRTPKDECETANGALGINGASDPKSKCLAMKDCEFVPGSCVCPCDFRLPGEPQCDCACGGGAPPMCRKKVL